MNCIVYFGKIQAKVGDFRPALVDYFGNINKTADIFNKTSINGDTCLLSTYFYGNTNQTVNFLFAQESENTLRVFIENQTKRDNLDQLINGVKHILGQLKSFFKKSKIECNEISATIYSEGEEVLTGEYQGFKKKLISLLPDIPTGIYLAILTVLYSLCQPKINSQIDEKNILLKNTFINLGIILLSVSLWLLIKSATSKKNISFKIK
jgi:hypothetical protein